MGRVESSEPSPVKDDVRSKQILEGTTGEFEKRVLDVLSASSNDCTALRSLNRLSGGASRETWTFDLVRTDGSSEGLILQLRRPLVWDEGLDIASEAEVLIAARANGVPVPRLVAFDPTSQGLGEPFLLLERISGETIPPRILRDPSLTAARRQLARQYGEALGLVQQIPRSRVPSLKLRDPLDHCRSILDGIGRSLPSLELGFRWLESNDPRAAVSPVVVHGDFRNGNGVVDPSGLRAIIDWELAHFGDPFEDLGWFCIPAWRFGASLRVGGLGNYEQLLGGYEHVTSRRVGLDVLHWWQVLGAVRWAVICMLQGETHLSGHRRSLELAAVGRRVAEAEHDLLLLLP